jgi:hypothetical protein
VRVGPRTVVEHVRGEGHADEEALLVRPSVRLVHPERYLEQVTHVTPRGEVAPIERRDQRKRFHARTAEDPPRVNPADAGGGVFTPPDLRLEHDEDFPLVRHGARVALARAFYGGDHTTLCGCRRGVRRNAYDTGGEGVPRDVKNSFYSTGGRKPRDVAAGPRPALGLDPGFKVSKIKQRLKIKGSARHTHATSCT